MSLMQDLHAIEREWERLGVPTSEVLAPGKTPHQIRSTLEALRGSDVAEDLVTWFTWHDGARANWIAAPISSQILSLQEATRAREDQLRVGSSDFDLPKWNDAWIPLTDAPSGSMFAVDMDLGSVLKVDWWSAEFARRVATDLSSAARVWVDVLRSGHYRWLDGAWDTDYGLLPAEVHASGLVS